MKKRATKKQPPKPKRGRPPKPPGEKVVRFYASAEPPVFEALEKARKKQKRDRAQYAGMMIAEGLKATGEEIE